MTRDTLRPLLLFKLEDKPPPLASGFVGFQHLLAMFGGLLTAPLLIALGMGVSAEETTYFIASSLIVSGFATLVQINRVGALGSGLLSIQGTSFAFIGPLVFSYQQLVLGMSSEEALGVIFGSCAVCSVAMMVMAVFVRELKHIITTNVAGATIILLGISLVLTTISNVYRVFNEAGGFEGGGLAQIGLATMVFLIIVVIALVRWDWLRLSAITVGLLIGVFVSWLMGLTDFSAMAQVDAYFIPQPWKYPLAVDLQVLALLLPIFLVSAMESIGDITATNNLSGLETGTPDYWLRIRGGIMAGGFASLVAALVCTFPSTTFSQNNGVIRLTGVCSRHVGNYLAAMLVILGCVPLVAALFQGIPGAVIYGATLLMFVLVGLSGFRVVEMSDPKPRDWVVVGLAIVLGYLLSLFVGDFPLPEEVIMVLQFPVSTGALLAIILEVIVPGKAPVAGHSGE